MLKPRFDKAFECLVSVTTSEFVVRHKVDAQRFSLYAKTHTHACTHMHTEFALSSNANAHLLDRCVSKSMPRSVSADPNSGKFFAPARLSFHETVATVESCVCVYAAACFGLPSRLYNVLLSEALMPVPPGPAQPGSAPVFGRYAGVQGAARRGFYYVFEACFPLGCRCVGAPPDVGFKKRLVFISYVSRFHSS